MCVDVYERKMSMEKLKERHNLTFDPVVWDLLNNLKKIHDESVSSIVEKAVLMYAKKEGFDPNYIKIMTLAEPCDPQEEEELTKLLNEVSAEDLKDYEVDEFDIEV